VATLDAPRSIESRGRGPAVVAHTAAGAVTLLDGRPPRVRRHVTPPFLADDVGFAPGGARRP
jgi:hypothetical protein